MKKLILFIALSIITANATQACICLAASFCETAADNTDYLVVSGVVSAVNAQNTELDIINVHSGTESKATITIWDGEGDLCFFTTIADASFIGQVGDTVVLSLDKIESKINAWDVIGDYRYVYQACTTTELSVDKGIVIGLLTQDNYSTMPFDDFNNKWNPEGTSCDLLLTTRNSKKEEIRIASLNKAIQINGGKGQAVVYNMLGKEVARATLKGATIINLKGAGVYLVSLNSNGNRTTRKVYVE